MRILTRLINHYLGILIVFSALMSHAVMAASRAVDAAELNDALKLYRSMTELNVEFEQNKHLKDIAMDLKSSGRLKVLPPDLVVWEILKPSPLSVKIDHDRVQIESGSGASKTTQTLALSEMGKDRATQGLGVLMPWLLLDSKRLAEDYRISETEKKSFSFEPRSSKPKFFTRIEARLGRSGALQSLLLTELSGDTLEIKFNEPKISRR